MKTHLRKGLAAILCIAMLVGLIPGVGTVTVSAATDGYEPATLTTDKYDIDGDGTNDSVYEIGNADQLYWFAQQVNSGSTSLNAVLTADIKVNENVLNDNGTLNTALTDPREWTPIGNSSNSFIGTFDGQNHTVSGLYFNDTEPTTGMYVGLFGCNGGTIQNVGVVDSYIKCLNFAGGVCGYNLNGTITNCHNSGEVIATATASACVGGVCGWNKWIIECSYNSGKVSASGDNAKIASAGGVCGWNYGTIENCYNIGEVSAAATEVNVGGVCGYNNSDSEILCCYYLESTASSVVGSDDGTTTSTESKTEAQFKSGEVAYLLNNEFTDGTQVWYQNLNNGVTPDDYPVFDGGTVYYDYLCNTNEKIYSNYPLNENENVNHDFDINGFCNNCGAYRPATDIDDDGVYEISNAGQLYWYESLVNGDKTHAEFDAKNTGAKAVLTADIDVSSSTFTSIGSSAANSFVGSFDGDGHKITVNQSGSDYVAIFGYIGACTIKNLTVTGTINTAVKYAAGIAMRKVGTDTADIENCISDVTIISSVNGDGTHGGIVGNADGTVNINNCAFTGAMQGETTNKCGGLIGYTNGAANISNSYVYADFGIDTANCNTFSRNDSKVTLTNCYYLNPLGSVPSGGVTQMSEAQFKSGEVAYLLQGEQTTQVWGQNIDNDKTPDDYPVLGGANVYRNDTYAGCSGYPGEPTETVYSNTDKEPVYADHSYNDNGFCKICDGYEPATLTTDKYDINGDGEKDEVYEISNAGQLYWYASLVNGDKTHAEFDAKNTGAKAVLTADITVNSNLLNSLVKDADGKVTNGDSFRSWTPIGNKSNNFTGTFDGQNHTVSGLYFNDTATNNVGLFGYADNGSSVSNVGVVDSYFNANSFVGGVFGFIGYNCTITNCYNTGEVIGADNHVGGVCGYNKNGKIDNCYNTGTVGGFNYVGGVCGYNYFYYGEQYYYGKIDNCYNTGKVSGGDAYVGGVCGYNGDRGTITNCYNTGEVSGTVNYVGGVSGYNKSTITNCYYLNTVAKSAVGTEIGSTNLTESKTEAQVKSGEVAYLLQSGQTADDKGNIPQVWGQNIDNDKTPDDYPVLSGAKVYQNYIYAGCVDAPGNRTIKYSNTQSDPAYAEHNYDNGFCTYCDGYEPATLTTDKYDINGDGEKDSVYEIGNAGQLYRFAQQVNSGSTSLNAVLTADITVNENVLNDNGTLNTALTDPREWTPIGNKSNIFTGTFDGQGYTVSGLYFNDTATNNVGLFGYVNGGSVSNVGVVDSYINAYDYVGGVCGYNLNGTIENCYNAGAVSAVNGTAYVGGVCGQNSGTIENCYNTGEVIGTGSNVGGVCGQNSGTITNCYYLNTVATSAVGSGDGTTNSTESKTEIEFKSGEVAYLLQGDQSTQVWGQNIDIEEPYDDYPVLGGTKVYKNYTYAGCSGNPGEPTIDYSNTGKNPFYVEHNYDNGFCKLCGGYEPATYNEADKVYEIGNAGQLYWFAYKVNNDNTNYGSANAVLTANITVNNELLNSLVKNADGNVTNGADFRSWTPIGDYSNAYQGAFDGHGYAISGLYCYYEGSDSEIFRVGLFGYIYFGSISNVGVVDSYFYAEDYVGGVCGYNTAGTISNCYNSGEVTSISKSLTDCVGGVCGINYCGTVINCYNTGIVTESDGVENTKVYVGGVCGHNDVMSTITNCYNAGAVSATGNNVTVGGVSGYNDFNSAITNCYNTGLVSATGNNATVGGVSGYNRSTITNCYYLNTVATSAVGSDIGSTNLTESKTEAQFKSGEVAYLLQSGQTADDKGNIPQVWGQNIDNDKTPDDYPVLSGAKVYENYTYAGCSGNPGNPTIKYSNTQSDPVYADHYDADDDGKCDYCGIFMDGSLAKLAFASLSLKGNIGVSFYMDLSTAVIDDSSAYMQFTLPNGSTEKILVSAAEKNTTIAEGKTYYVFSCEVAAKEMTADIKAQIISGDSASESFTYTVKKYADTLLNSEEYDAETKKLVISMLNYGAASQEYFDYNTDSLANSSLTDEQKRLPDTQASELSAYKSSYTKDENYKGSTSYYGSSLVLESGTDVKHYFAYDLANTSVDSFVCKYGNDNNYQISQSGDYLYVRIDNIPAHKLGDTLTLSLYGDDVKVGEISYSPLSYVYSVLSAYPTDDGTHDALRNNVKALYEYYKAAAAAYLNVQQSAA
ncbi:MAG: GLUG motif-containing protein [Acutalibacteraceae bacterium]